MNFNITVEAVISKLTGESQYEFCERLFHRLLIRHVEGQTGLFFLLDGYCIMSFEVTTIFIEPMIWDHLQTIKSSQGKKSNPYADFDGAIGAIKGAAKKIFGLPAHDVHVNTFDHSPDIKWV